MQLDKQLETQLQLSIQLHQLQKARQLLTIQLSLLQRLSTLLDQLQQLLIQPGQPRPLLILLLQEVRVLTQVLPQLSIQLSLQQMKKLKVM